MAAAASSGTIRALVGVCYLFNVFHSLNNLYNVHKIQHPVKPASPTHTDRVEGMQCGVSTAAQHSQVSRLSLHQSERGLRAEATLIRFQSGKAGLGRNSAFTLQHSWEGLQLHHDPGKMHRGDVKQKMTFDLLALSTFLFKAGTKARALATFKFVSL